MDGKNILMIANDVFLAPSSLVYSDREITKGKTSDHFYPMKEDYKKRTAAKS